MNKIASNKKITKGERTLTQPKSKTPVPKKTVLVNKQKTVRINDSRQARAVEKVPPPLRPKLPKPDSPTVANTRLRTQNQFRRAFGDISVPGNSDTPVDAKSTSSSPKPSPTHAVLMGSKSPGIPRSGINHPLRAASLGGGYSEQIQSRLKKKSPWYTSIMDPLHGMDCKIPDETGEETGTVQIVENYSITTTSAGQPLGVRILNPYVNNNNAVGSDVGVNYQTLTTASTALALAWGLPTASGETQGYQWTGAGDLKAITNNHRVVSCAIYAEHEASLSTNQGEFCAYVVPMGSTNAPLYATYSNFYGASLIPLNQNKPAAARWFPMQAINTDAVSGNVTTLSYKTFVPTDNSDNFLSNWELGILTSGLATGVTVRFKMVVNYEFLPTFNTLNIVSASPSPVDLEEESLVGGWVESMPITGVAVASKVNSAPTVVTPQHGDEPTGFGMLADVIKEILPFAAMLL
jgi:hypothetical protein